MTDWPSTSAGFPGNCKECNAEWKKGTKIYGINADTDKQKRWCSNGNCPDSAGVPPPTPSTLETKQKPVESKEKMALFPHRIGEFIDANLLQRHREAWAIALLDASIVHPQNNTDSIRAKYILACVFYKGLMGVS